MSNTWTPKEEEEELSSIIGAILAAMAMEEKEKERERRRRRRKRRRSRRGEAIFELYYSLIRVFVFSPLTSKSRGVEEEDEKYAGLRLRDLLACVTA